LTTTPPYVADQTKSKPEGDFGLLNNPTLRIGIFPNDHNYTQNIVFRKDWILNSGWCEAMVALRQMAQANNIEIATSDLVALSNADVILFINLPAHRSEVQQLRRQVPTAKLALIASESPVVQPHAAVAANHLLFDRVFVRSPPRRRNLPRYRQLPPGCAYQPDPNPAAVPFTERRFGIMVNSNMNTGLLRSPRPWHVLNQGRSIRRGGWSLPYQRQLQVALGSRYHCRRSFARAVQHLGIQDFDIYGQGWQALRHGWFHRLWPEQHWRLWRGPLKADKLHTLCHYRFAFCYENFEGNEGYISEKIFDALAAGTVPLCLGDSHLKSWIPNDCAVFRSDYSSDQALLEDLLNWDEARWSACRQAGQSFLYSDRIQPFLPHAYAEKVLEGLISILP
jgi:hypothetical protein